MLILLYKRVYCKIRQYTIFTFKTNQHIDTTTRPNVENTTKLHGTEALEKPSFYILYQFKQHRTYFNIRRTLSTTCKKFTNR